MDLRNDAVLIIASVLCSTVYMTFTVTDPYFFCSIDIVFSTI